jgi:Zn-dependent protease with chaperone function/uncharacterized RDD family membrane protein YckC
VGMVEAAHADASTIFAGSQSLRVPNEWRLLWWSLVCIAACTPLLAYAFPTFASAKELALLVIGAMIYVTFARGRLIGGSIRVHAGQFGHVYEVALECSRALRMPVPNVFVRDDPVVPIVAVGIGEPYSLIISAQWVEHLTPQELRFLIGRELAHIDAGHTRITSLLSVNGRENAIVSILFGSWLRRIEYTADRAGLLCCASLESALSAISVSTFHLVGRSIDLTAFAEQQHEIDAERALRIGEWVSSVPYATKRIAALRNFARDALYLQWSVRFEEYRVTPYVAPPLPAGAVARRVYANFPRRLAAFAIDFLLIQALIPSLPAGIVVVRVNAQAARSGGLAAVLHDLVRSHPHLVSILDTGVGWGALIVLVYYTLLVGLAGQTFGMMIVDLRVVSERFGRVGLVRALVRLGCLIGSMVTVIGLVKIFSRIQPFEKWSGTRLIAGGAYIRSREKITGQPLEAASPLFPLSP